MSFRDAVGITSQSNAVCLCWLSRKDVFLSKGGGWRTLGSIFQGLCLHQSTSTDGCFSSSLGLILSFQPFSQVRDINSQTCSLPGFQVAPGSTRILGLVSGRFLRLFSDLLIRVKMSFVSLGPFGFWLAQINNPRLLTELWDLIGKWDALQWNPRTVPSKVSQGHRWPWPRLGYLSLQSLQFCTCWI